MRSLAIPIAHRLRSTTSKSDIVRGKQLESLPDEQHVPEVSEVIRQTAEVVVGQVEMLQPAQRRQVVGELVQGVSGRVETLQVGENADAVERPEARIAGELETTEVREAAEGVRQVRDVVAGHVE